MTGPEHPLFKFFPNLLVAPDEVYRQAHEAHWYPGECAAAKSIMEERITHLRDKTAATKDLSDDDWDQCLEETQFAASADKYRVTFSFVLETTRKGKITREAALSRYRAWAQRRNASSKEQ